MRGAAKEERPSSVSFADTFPQGGAKVVVDLMGGWVARSWLTTERSSMENEILQQVGVADETGAAVPDAGEHQDFEDLIRGPYKEDFDRRVQKILDGRLRTLRRENEALREQRQRQQETARAAFAALETAQQEVGAVYPEFDWRREVENREFSRLIAAGVAPRTAYEVVHSRELMGRAMAYAAQQTARRAAGTVAAGARRVREGGGRSTALSRVDPRKLTGSELADIRRRVMDGEKIRF